MNASQYILIGAVRVYKWFLSPAKTFIFGPGGRCRFEPSCSDYALESLRTHGALKGSWLGLRRLGRCHPWGGCGWDPVPPNRSRRCGSGCSCDTPETTRPADSVVPLSSPMRPSGKTA